jgi:hypothetical protein
LEIRKEHVPVEGWEGGVSLDKWWGKQILGRGKVRMGKWFACRCT